MEELGFGDLGVVASDGLACQQVLLEREIWQSGNIGRANILMELLNGEHIENLLPDVKIRQAALAVFFAGLCGTADNTEEICFHFGELCWGDSHDHRHRHAQYLPSVMIGCGGVAGVDFLTGCGYALKGFACADGWQEPSAVLLANIIFRIRQFCTLRPGQGNEQIDFFGGRPTNISTQLAFLVCGLQISSADGDIQQQNSAGNMYETRWQQVSKC